MGFQPINFLNAELLESPWSTDFSKVLKEGMDLRQNREKFPLEQNKRVLENQKMNEEAPYWGRKAQADVNLAESHGKVYEAQSKLPFGGALTGDVGQAVYAQDLKDKGHPAAQRASDLLEGLIFQRNNSSLTQSGRHAREQGVAELKLAEVMQNPNSTPAQKKSAQRVYDASTLAQAKNVEQSWAQQQAVSVKNLHTALDSANVDKMKYLVGGQGYINRKKEQANAIIGKKQSHEYAEALASMSALKDAAAQYATVINTPAAQMLRQEINSIVDTVSDPHQAALITPETFEYTQKKIRELMNAQAQTSNQGTISGLSENAQNETEDPNSKLNKTAKKYESKHNNSNMQPTNKEEKTNGTQQKKRWKLNPATGDLE